MKLNPMLGHIYDEDKPLFRELGLTPFQNVENWERVTCGSVTFDNGSRIDVIVQCAPAQFWSFIVYDAERKVTYYVDTGSGTLSEYWPMVKSMANSMFTVKSIIEGEAVENE